MGAKIAQETDIGQLIQPFSIIHYQGISWPIAKDKVFFEYFLNTLFIFFDILVRQKRARFILARGVANFSCAAAHQNNWLMACALQKPQHHNLNKRANMQTVSGAIKADIG